MCDGEARKNMTGELAPARHVFSAATSSQKPGSNRSQNVTPVAVSTPLANLVKVTPVFSVSRPREVCNQNIARVMEGN
jgi:hypothetical protein